MRWSALKIPRAISTGSSSAIEAVAALQAPEAGMKSLAAVGAAAFIAMAGALWFRSGPAIVTMKVEPLKPSADLPTFKRIVR